MRSFRFILLSAACALLAACSDPSSEEPISLQPGLYQITMDRTALGPVKVGYDPKEEVRQCVSSEGDIEWIYPLIARKFCPDCSCTTEDKVRTGNAIGARTVCPHDDQGEFGALEYAFQGVVAPEGVTIEGKIKSGLATYVAPDATEAEKAEAAEVAKNCESITMSGKIERVGDCTG